MMKMEDKVLELLSAILAKRYLRAIELCNEIEDGVLVKYQKQLEEGL